jgi:hypothetical protein
MACNLLHPVRTEHQPHWALAPGSKRNQRRGAQDGSNRMLAHDRLMSRMLTHGRLMEFTWLADAGHEWLYTSGAGAP